MKTKPILCIAKYFAEFGKFLTIHLIAFSALGTGFFIVFTASDLGALAAFVISMGIYIALFGLLLELSLILRFALRWLSRKILGF